MITIAHSKSNYKVMATLTDLNGRFVTVQQMSYGYDRVYFYPNDVNNLKFITQQLVNKINYYNNVDISLLILFTGALL
jgi:hypothetical protein